MGIAALVTAVAPSRRNSGDDTPAAQAPEPQGRDRGAPERVRFREPPPKRLPEERISRTEQSIVEVRVRRPGEVTLEGLGLVQAAGARTPAVFDLFPSRTGRYRAVFRPAGGRPEPLGTLVVSE